MAWASLFLAGLLEVAWAIGLKHSEGYTRLWPSIWTTIAMVLSVVLLAYAMRGIPMGTAYAVWSGIGAVGTALAGIWLYSESAHPFRLVSISLIVIGIVGLKFAVRD